ncbi:hypothetical protein CGRA01v4_11952 [Colletotrichum graminicola]|nr:hypothetical protein CGRA01v4_11952 [Colletotrichum graminicola]
MRRIKVIQPGNCTGPLCPSSPSRLSCALFRFRFSSYSFCLPLLFFFSFPHALPRTRKTKKTNKNNQTLPFLVVNPSPAVFEGLSFFFPSTGFVLVEG